MKPSQYRRILIRMGFLLLWLIGVGISMATLAGESRPPILIGLTAEFSVTGSQAAQSIAQGINLAIDEINADGILPNGQKLALVTRDDRGVPARGMDNFTELARNPDVIAVFCGRFSPVALELAPLSSQFGLPLLDPWAAADAITRPLDKKPNYVFRLSLTDTWAIETIARHARSRGATRYALFVPNTAWGRSNEAALLRYLDANPGLSSKTYWYNWGDADFSSRLKAAQREGAQTMFMVANEAEGIHIVSQMAALPAENRLPIIAHWGILGGAFFSRTQDSLQKLDFSLVYTFSFADPRSPKAEKIAKMARERLGIDVMQMSAQAGFAQAYDLTHLLAQAIIKAKSSDRLAVRNALEQLGPYSGIFRLASRPFTPNRHEALEKSYVRIGRFDKSGNLRSIALQ